MRLRIDVNISKPLPLGVWIPRLNGQKTRVVYKYEKLQNISYGCGLIGYEKSTCQNPRIQARDGGKFSRYGP